MGTVNEWNELAAQLGVDSIRSATAAGSGHPTSSLSAAHLVAVLWSDHLRYDVADPKSLANDRFVLSKGHASPLIFSVLKAVGAIGDEQLLSFRRFGSPVQGHPAPLPEMPWIDVATGSLGQGLPIALGMALAMKMDAIPARVWCLMGDSEVAEGSVWEAMENASHHGADNLIAIIDVNRLGQRGPTMLQWDLETYAARARSFGWHPIEIDGHDVAAIDAAFTEAEGSDVPAIVIAKTEKGHGVSFLANQEGWHGKALSQEEADRAIAELGGPRDVSVTPRKPEAGLSPPADVPNVVLPVYAEAVATRKAFGETLAALVVRGDVVAIDGEVANSTHTEDLQKVAPDRFVESYIAEQNMLGMAVGMQVLGKVVFPATFAAFLTRAYDFIRMAAISRANIRLSGSHAGVSIGEDGPSQMALEDLAMMRAVHGSTVLYPSDPNQTARLVAEMADREGIIFMRTTRAATPVLYDASDEFQIGGSRVLRRGDDLAIVAAGITLHESLKAADKLIAEGIDARVIDLYSVKPMDVDTLRAASEATGGRIITVEDHWSEGGIGDAVLEALSDDGELPPQVVRLAVREMPGSGKPAELLAAAGIDADHIAQAARALMGAAVAG